MNQIIPSIYEIPTIYESNGKISILEGITFLPFEVKRIFYIYDTPSGTTRGKHAHRQLKQFIWCIKGCVQIVSIDRNKKISEFILDKPNKGLYMPELTWSNQISLSKDSIYCVAASDYYDEME